MMSSNQHQELSAIRARAVALHAQLLLGARVKQEFRLGREIAPAELLDLAAFGDELKWLQPLTRAIVDLDLALEAAPQRANAAAKAA